MFLSTMWSLNVSAFDIDGISYEILSNLDRTVCVAQQTAIDQVVGHVKIPSSVFYMGRNYAVTEISSGAFSGCNQMTSIVIPASLKKIEASAFRGCSKLSAVHLEDLAAWCSVEISQGTDTNPVSMTHHLFVDSVEVTTLVIPESVTSISHDAFREATALTSVVIPSTVTEIGANAFAGCRSIATLSMGDGDNKSLTTIIGDRAFSECDNLEVVTIPEGTEQMGQYIFYHCTKLRSVQLPQSLRVIGNSAFQGCSSLTSIDIPGKVTTLGAWAFYECGQLARVSLSDNITAIGDWAFTRCYQLKGINIPKNVTRIGDYAFLACSLIEELALPKTLTSIVPTAFVGCKGLRNVTVEEGSLSYVIDNGALLDYDKTILLLFPAQCDRTAYVIPSTVQTIVAAAFYGCKLKRLTLPPALTKLGNSSLSGLTQLESITIPATVTEIGPAALSGCRTLKEIVIPNSVRNIGMSAFSGCSSLVKVTLGAGCQVLDGGAFSGCNNIRHIWSYIEDPSDIADNDSQLGETQTLGACFTETVTREAVLYVPQGTIEKYQSKRGWRDFASIVEADIAAISTPSSDSNTRAQYYDLNGRRLKSGITNPRQQVANPRHRGIYIVNGKKYN